jgi:hypothetical protein
MVSSVCRAVRWVPHPIRAMLHQGRGAPATGAEATEAGLEARRASQAPKSMEPNPALDRWKMAFEKARATE